MVEMVRGLLPSAAVWVVLDAPVLIGSDETPRRPGIRKTKTFAGRDLMRNTICSMYIT
jgi:hypothetical protein